MLICDQQQIHPDGCFSDFMHFFGPHIFVLWKLALLHKRIIFYSPPPVGEVCHRGVCVCVCVCVCAVYTIDNVVLYPICSLLHFTINLTQAGQNIITD